MVKMESVWENKPREYGFAANLNFANNPDRRAALRAGLKRIFPGIVGFEEPTRNEDRSGTDLFARMLSGHLVSFNEKFRNDDPIEKFGKDDLAIEYLSVVEKNIIGWSLNPNLRTDWTVWGFPTGRIALVPTQPLVRLAQLNIEAWKKRYKCAQQFTQPSISRDGWHSKCVFVPRSIIWEGIRELLNRQPNDHIEEQLDLLLAEPRPMPPRGSPEWNNLPPPVVP
jgi:hypothetical protein